MNLHSLPMVVMASILFPLISVLTLQLALLNPALILQPLLLPPIPSPSQIAVHLALALASLPYSLEAEREQKFNSPNLLVLLLAPSLALIISQSELIATLV